MEVHRFSIGQSSDDLASHVIVSLLSDKIEGLGGGESVKKGGSYYVVLVNGSPFNVADMRLTLGNTSKWNIVFETDNVSDIGIVVGTKDNKIYQVSMGAGGYAIIKIYAKKGTVGSPF